MLQNAVFPQPFVNHLQNRVVFHGVVAADGEHALGPKIIQYAHGFRRRLGIAVGDGHLGDIALAVQKHKVGPKGIRSKALQARAILFHKAFQALKDVFPPAVDIADVLVAQAQIARLEAVKFVQLQPPAGPIAGKQPAAARSDVNGHMIPILGFVCARLVNLHVQFIQLHILCIWLFVV